MGLSSDDFSDDSEEVIDEVGLEKLTIIPDCCEVKKYSYKGSPTHASHRTNLGTRG